MAKEAQQSFIFRSHGGLRKNAGRKRLLKSDPSHSRREKIDAKTPAHITMKLNEHSPGLRTPQFIRAFTRAVKRAQKFGLRVQHFSIESNHIHFIAESDNNQSMTSGLISLKTSFAWALRRIFMFHGKVFVGRYHMRLLKSPTDMRNVLRYVLFNHAHHCKKDVFVDPYSSVLEFQDIEALIKQRIVGSPASWQQEIRDCLSRAKSWMQSYGWRKAKY